MTKWWSRWCKQTDRPTTYLLSCDSNAASLSATNNSARRGAASADDISDVMWGTSCGNWRRTAPALPWRHDVNKPHATDRRSSSYTAHITNTFTAEIFTSKVNQHLEIKISSVKGPKIEQILYCKIKFRKSFISKVNYSHLKFSCKKDFWNRISN